MASETAPYRVVIDSREQLPWSFPANDHCLGSVVRTLKTGDYTLEGYESALAIERKGSVCEFVQNITQTEKWERFKDELGRLEAFPAAVVLCEFTYDDVMTYPHSTSLPQSIKKKIKVSPQFYLKRLVEIELRFKAKVVLAGPRFARDVASCWFKRVVERWPHAA